MKSIVSQFLILLVVTSSWGRVNDKTYQWANGENKIIDVDLGDKGPLNIKLIINNLDQHKIIKTKISCETPKVDKEINFDDEKDKAGNIDLGSYIRQAFSGNALDSLLESKVETKVIFTLFSSNNEKMYFVLKLSPKRSAQETRDAGFPFNPPPVPKFSHGTDTTDFNKRHRILILDGTGNVDANSGHQLLSFRKVRKGKEKEGFRKVPVKSLVVNKSLSVFTSNIDLDNLYSIELSLNGTEYSYNAGIADIQAQLSGIDRRSSGDHTAIEVGTGNGKAIDTDPQPDVIKTYLKSSKEHLAKLEFMNIIDLKRLQTYKSQLKKSIDDSSIPLDEEAFGYYFDIMNFQSEYINLTPFALTVPNADEVVIESTLKFGEGRSEEKYTTGVFRTSGCLTVHVGSSLFFTGLKNNAVYTETIMVDGQEELRAKMDEENQLSVGVGVNSEISYRTGSMVRPSLNIAFFVPLGEDITPFVGFGPGISITDKKVNFNLSGGLAFGKVNSINERYRDRNLSAISNLTNTGLVQQVWSGDWYASLGVGFNLRSGD